MTGRSNPGLANPDRGTMPCTKCGSVTRVYDTRLQKGGHPAIRRRRRCTACGHRFVTMETDRDTLLASDIRFRVDLVNRYLALDEAGQRAVRAMVTALESARALPLQGQPPPMLGQPFASGGFVTPGKPYLIGERA